MEARGLGKHQAVGREGRKEMKEAGSLRIRETSANRRAHGHKAHIKNKAKF